MGPEGLSRRRRWLVLAICCVSLFIVGLDSTIVNVALPSIQRDLHAPVSGLQWTVDAYTLVLASFLILSGSTADRVGRRRIFQTGLVLFTLGSLLCSLAPGLGWLVAFRLHRPAHGAPGRALRQRGHTSLARAGEPARGGAEAAREGV
jgi:MFS family permease